MVKHFKTLEFNVLLISNSWNKLIIFFVYCFHRAFSLTIQ